MLRKVLYLLDTEVLGELNQKAIDSKYSRYLDLSRIDPNGWHLIDMVSYMERGVTRLFLHLKIKDEDKPSYASLDIHHSDENKLTKLDRAKFRLIRDGQICPKCNKLAIISEEDYICQVCRYTS